MFLAGVIGIPLLGGASSFHVLRAEEKGEETGGEPGGVEEFWFKDMYNTTLGTSAIGAPKSPANEDAPWLGTYAWFGKYEGNPVLYRILNPKEQTYGGSAGSILLDSDTILFNKIFDSNGGKGNWSNSTVKTDLNGDAFLTKEGVFTDLERNAILESNRASHELVQGSGKGKVTTFAKNYYANFVGLSGEKIFLLDAEDIYNPSYGYSNDDSLAKNRRKFGPSGWEGYWFLRSATEDSDKAGEVDSDGETGGSKASSSSGIAPALNLDRSQVVFTSVVEGINEETGYGAQVKFTLKDKDIIVTPDTTEGYYNASGVVHVPYKITGEHATTVNQLSVVFTKDKTITDQSQLLYYTSLESQYGLETTGEALFLKPTSVTGRWGKDYHVFLIAESIHETCESDYAGEFVELPEPSLGVPVDQSVFPDGKFLEYVKQFDLDNDGFFIPYELASVKKIDCSQMGIHSLDGIWNFFNLEELRCTGNKLSVLDVEMNTTLKYIYCADNEIEILYISGCKSLVTLSCGNNHIDQINLIGKYSLKNLYCKNNELSMLDVTECMSLVNLDCRLNYIPQIIGAVYITDPLYSPQRPDIYELNATVTNNSTVNLKWDMMGDVDRYEIWEKDSPDGQFYLAVDSVESNSYTMKVNKSGTIAFQIRGYVQLDGENYYGRDSFAVKVKLGLPAPSNVKAVSESATSVKVSWDAVSGASGYQVWRSTSPDKDFVAIGSVTTTSRSSTALKTGTKYYYKVRAYDEVNGKRAYGEFSSVVSAIPKVAKPANVKATCESAVSAKVSWSAVTGATGYQVWRSTSPNKDFVAVGSVAETSRLCSGLTTGTTYYFKVRAYKEVSGTKYYGDYSTVVSVVPKIVAPSGVKAVSASATSIKVSWNAVSGMSGYQVWRSTSPDKGFVAVGSVTETSRVCSGLMTGTTYYFKVRAYKESNGTKVYGEYSTVVSAAPKLSAPSGVKATVSSATSVTVSWNKVTGATGYEVWRSEKKDSGFSKTGSVTETSRKCPGLTSGKTYYFKVRAYKEVNGTKVYSAYSTVVSAVPK